MKVDERKKFFFEKKNQKTSAPCGIWPISGSHRHAGPAWASTRTREQKFFAPLFFKKAAYFPCFLPILRS
jgi:hypothetical protein